MTASDPTIRETRDAGKTLPLSGFRVLDLTRFLSGPYCTMVLAELGADVIKIEQPHTGDDSRRLAPKIDGESYPFAMPNRSKRSVSLDLKTEQGLAVFRRMAAEADLVIENFRPGVAKRLGIGYDDLKAVREDILYCSISGFGQTGPYRDRPGFDIMAQGMVGFLRMTGEPGGRPAKVGIAINDIAAGATAIYSIMAAEMHRRATGEGQYMDISLVDAGLAWAVWESGAYFGAGEVPEPVARGPVGSGDSFLTMRDFMTSPCGWLTRSTCHRTGAADIGRTRLFGGGIPGVARGRILQARRKSSTASTRLDSVRAVGRPSFSKMLETYFSTTPTLICSFSAMPWFELPPAISWSTSRSRGVSVSTGSSGRSRAISCDTTSGSSADPPAATRRSAPVNSSRSVTRSLSR